MIAPKRSCSAKLNHHLYLILTLSKETEFKRWNAKELLRRQHWWHKVICRLDKALRTLRLLEKRWKTGKSTELIWWLLDCSLGDTGIPHRASQGCLGWVIKIQTPLCSDLSIPHQVPISFFIHMSKNKSTQEKVQQNCYIWGNTTGKNILQTPGRNWMGGWIQDLTSTLFYKHCSYKKTLKRTDRSENAWESTRKGEMKTKRKPLPCKKGTWETHTINIKHSRMALKGTTDSKSRGQHS